jgi:membrane associated rhomboid family serine protease
LSYLASERPQNLPAQRQQELRAHSVLLEDMGGVAGPHIVQGEYWRLVSSAFVHLGVPHLLMNMLALYILGRFAERMWGRARFLILYLLSALGGAVLAMIYNPESLLMGASGGVCGLFGGIAVWIILNREHIPPDLLWFWMRNLGLSIILITLTSVSFERISGSAHLGGGVFGAIVGGLLNFHRFGTPLQRWLAVAGTLAVPTLSVAYLVHTASHDAKWGRVRGDPVTSAPAADDLYRQFVPRAQQADEEADKVYSKSVYPLLSQEPQTRDPDAVRDSIAALNQARSRLIEVSVELLQEAGPYSDKKDEAIRVNLARYLREKADLQDLLALRLEKGANYSAADRLSLDAKRGVVRALDPGLRRQPKQ